jgi:hypothetical protein
LRQKEAALQKQLTALPENSPERGPLQAQLKQLRGEQKTITDKVKQAGNRVQFYQEIGGLAGRLTLAYLAVIIVSRQKLLRVFQIPGLLIVPLVFLYPARYDLELLKWGMFLAGFLTVAQFSFWGNYLPRVYPLHLRGTGESFSANVGGRMIGTSAAFITTNLIAPYLVKPVMPDAGTFSQVAVSAAIMAAFVYAVGLIASFWLPEPKAELPETAHEAVPRSEARV